MPKPSKFKKIAQTSWFRIVILIIIGLIIWGGSYAKQKYDQRYLVIKEWGVRLELPGDIRGKVAYKMGYGDQNSQYLIFYSPQLAQKTSHCGVDIIKNNIGLGLALQRYSKAYFKGHFPTDKSRAVNGLRYGRIAIIGNYAYYVNMPAANGDGHQSTAEEDRIKELSQIPTGCYQANYPSKPSAQDQVWQESQEIFKALQPATYSLKKV